MVKLVFLLTLLLSNALWAGLTIEEVDPYKAFESALAKNKKEAEKKKDPDKKEIEKKDTQNKDKTSEKTKDTKNDPNLPTFCDTAKEFQEAYEALVSGKLVELPDRGIIAVSYEVTKGCDGAAGRFKRILAFLVNTGVDKRKSVEIALQFAMRSEPETVAFTEVFKGTFLEKYMDLDFKTALRTSFKLALAGKGDPNTIAKDFRSILDYCLENKNIDLPFKVCAPLALELTKYTYLYGKDGLSDSFKKLMTFLQEQKEIDYNISAGLKNAGKILRYGPKSIENFENQYKYAISDKMRLPRKAALGLAIRVAENTLNIESKEVMNKEINKEPFVLESLIPEKKLNTPTEKIPSVKK